MNRRAIAKAITKLNPEGDRIGLDAILQHVERETKRARQANLNGIKLAHGRPAQGTEDSNDDELAAALGNLVTLRNDLDEFLTAVTEGRRAKVSAPAEFA